MWKKALAKMDNLQLILSPGCAINLFIQAVNPVPPRLPDEIYLHHKAICHRAKLS